jgi:hypothetical protein
VNLAVVNRVNFSGFYSSPALAQTVRETVSGRQPLKAEK